MNNKDEKTFADLFSSSTTEKEEPQTFGNIFKSEQLEEEKESIKSVESSSNDNITFDNIFDNVSKMEEESNEVVNQSEEEIKLPQNEESIIIDNPFFENEEASDKINFNDIEEKSEVTTANIVENEKTEEPTSEEENTSSPEFNNPFFNSNEESVEVSEPSNNNPFFEEVKEEQTKEEIIEESPIINNEFDTSKITKEETNITNDNLFFYEQSDTNSPVIDLKLSDSDNTEQVDNNPFFQNESTEVEKPKVQPEEPKKEPEKTVSKSTSPFFGEEKKEDTNNPFFQGQLNLVENKQHNNPVNNIDTTKSKHYNVKIVKKKESPIKFILGVLSYALFIFLLLIGITLLIYVLDTKIRAAKGDYSTPTFNAYVVLTGSMLPEIEVNDVVVTKKVDAATLKEGDIITFASADSRFQGTIITHRIIKKNPDDGTNGYTFQTRGDNNNVADSALVPEANIFGKVILKIPKLGYLQEFLASDGGWIIVILIPCLTVISYDTVKLIKGLKRKKYKNIKVQK